MKNDHHKLSRITRELEIWLGEVASARSPGRKIKVTDRILDLVEWAHIYFLKLALNDKKRENPPDDPITVYNRWWDKDYKTPCEQRPHEDWPDIIDFIDGGYQTNLFGSVKAI